MKRTLRLSALLGSLCVALGVPAVRPAAACVPTAGGCATIDGSACSTVGTHEKCTAPGVCETGGCTCNSSHVWSCLF